MEGFLTVSPKLLQNLTPRAFVLFYVYEHFVGLPGGKFCFAGNQKIMAMAGIRDPRVFRRCRQELIDKGLIARVGEGSRGCSIFDTLYRVKGTAVFNRFLFAQGISATEKVVQLSRAIFHLDSIRKTASRIGLSLSTVKAIPSPDLSQMGPAFMPVSHGQKTPRSGAEKRTTSNVFSSKSLITNNSLNLTNAPPEEIPDPEPEPNVVSSSQLDFENELWGVKQLELWDQGLYDKINETWAKRAPEEVKMQAALEAERMSKKGQVRKSKLVYALGMISPNRDRSFIPTCERIVEGIRKNAKRKKARIQREGALQKQREEEKNAEEIQMKNQVFWVSLTDQERLQSRGVIEQLGNPSGLPFVTYELALNGALGTPEFRDRVGAQILGKNQSRALV